MNTLEDKKTWRQRWCPRFCSTNRKPTTKNANSHEKPENLQPVSDDLVVTGDSRETIISQIRERRDKVWYVRRNRPKARVLGGASYMRWHCWLVSSRAEPIVYVFAIPAPGEPNKFLFVTSNTRGSTIVLSAPKTLPRVFHSSDNRLFKLTVSTRGRRDVLLHLPSKTYVRVDRNNLIKLTTLEALANETSLTFQTD